MYQHKENREEYKVHIDFINGYLANLAKLKDAWSKYLGHTYYFEQIDKHEKTLEEVVSNKVMRSIERFYKEETSQMYKPDKYKALLIDEFTLQFQENWKTFFKNNSAPWIGINWLQAFEQQDNWYKPDFLIQNFIELIDDFFVDTEIKMYSMEGRIIGELYYHWGGIGFQDFFFDTKEFVYHLHFDYCD